MSGSVCGGIVEARFHAYQGYDPREDIVRHTLSLHLSDGVRGTKEDLGGTSTLQLEAAGVGSMNDILIVICEISIPIVDWMHILRTFGQSWMNDQSSSYHSAYQILRTLHCEWRDDETTVRHGKGGSWFQGIFQSFSSTSNCS